MGIRGSKVSSVPRAPIFRPRREPAQPAGETPTGEQFVTTGMTVDSSAPPQNASVRTIILGIDHSGRIVQHDRNAPTVLGRPAEKLLGSSLSDLLLDPSPPEGTEAKDTDAKRAGSNGTTGQGGAKSESGRTVPPPAVAGDDVVPPPPHAGKGHPGGPR